MLEIFKIIDVWDKKMLLWVNSWHTPMLNTLMTWASETRPWIPFYMLLIGLMVWKFKQKSLYYLLGIVLVVTLADQFTSTFMKPFFARLRPCHFEELKGILDLPDGCGGKYGFASSHAANTIGVAFFLFWLFRNTFKYSHLLFVWAVFVSFSRVYLAAHYFTDIIVGGLVGLFCAFLVWNIPKLERFLV